MAIFEESDQGILFENRAQLPMPEECDFISEGM